MTTAFHVNGTQLHAAGGIAFSYGTLWMLASGPSAPERDLFTQGRPMGDGDVFLGIVRRGRPFPLRFYFECEEDNRAKGFEAWDELLAVLSPDSGLMSFRHVREAVGGGSESREMFAVVLDEPAAAAVEGGADQPGVRKNGNFLFQTQAIAPYPWWRSIAPAEQEVITVTGASPNGATVARPGRLPCGAVISVATSGALSSMAVSNGTRQIVMSATFGASAKTVDWYGNYPWLTEIGAGVQINRDAHFTLDSESVAVTCTPNGGATGTHTVTIDYYPLHKTV